MKLWEQIIFSTCDTDQSDCHFKPVFHLKGANKQIKITKIKKNQSSTDGHDLGAKLFQTTWYFTYS